MWREDILSMLNGLTLHRLGGVSIQNFFENDGFLLLM